MSSSYLHIKQPPWRYVASSAAFVTIVIVLFAALHSTDVSPRIAISREKSSGNGRLVDDVFNTTLGFEKILAVSLPERTDHRDGLILASAVSNINIAFIDGVHGDEVLEKTLPPVRNKDLGPSTIGSWRAHLNAIAELVPLKPICTPPPPWQTAPTFVALTNIFHPNSSVVHNNYTTALILEDDVDWDIRLKPLLADLALSSHALLLSPDATAIKFNNLPSLAPPSASPYGDTWDLLWLGHCGMALPAPSSSIILHYNDSSVPEPHYLHSWRVEDPSPLLIYPNHTRLVMRQVSDPVCSLAYAVSQAGARKILYALGLKSFDGPFDLMLKAWCEGLGSNEEGGRQKCLGVLPQLFDHHRGRGPKSRESDIQDHGGEYRDKPETLNIRWSVRMNLERILKGEAEWEDQWPDTMV